MQSQVSIYLDSYIPNGYSDLKDCLFTNNTEKMYNEAHKHFGCTRIVGLIRLSIILEQMKECIPSKNFSSSSRV